MGKIKATELRQKTKGEITEQLVKLRTELTQLRVAQVTGQGGASKLSNIKVTRKNIARCLTVINQKQIAAVRAAYAGKKHKPKSIRTKGTRHSRRALSEKDKSRKTVRQQKRERNFPLLKFTLKA